MSSKYEQIKNASFVLAGMACFLIILSEYYSSGLLHVKGIWTLFPLALPLLGYWYGLFFRVVVHSPKRWLAIIVTLAAILVLINLSTSKVFYDYTNTLRTLLFALLGYLIPLETVENEGANLKIGGLLLLSLIAYVTCEFTLVRIDTGHMAEGYEDMKELVLSILKYGIWAPTVLAIYFSTAFSFTKAGQWLGSRIWYRWIASLLMVVVFIGIFVQAFRWGIKWWGIFDFIFQPVAVYLGIIIYRLVCNRISGKEIKKYDNVFKIW